MTTGIKLLDVTGQPDQAAGLFSTWLEQTLHAQQDPEGVAEVACGECNACCKSSYFIHIRPDETAALAAIPRALQFPAPGLPPGHMIVGYDEHGKCPMLIDESCSIYEQRPATCRKYDCRIFTATGIAPGGEEKQAVTRRAGSWRFEYPGKDDARAANAIRAAVKFLLERPDSLPGGKLRTPSQLAIFALQVHTVFLEDKDQGANGVTIDERIRAIAAAATDDA